MQDETPSSEVQVLQRELYTIAEAAHLLRLPRSTLRWWLEGRDPRPPVIRAEPTGSSNVTWGEFVEAGFLREYRKLDVSLQHLRPVIEGLRHEFGVPYPLAHFRLFVGSGQRLVLETQKSAKLPSELSIVFEVVGGQLLLSSAAESFMSKVDFFPGDDDWVQRIHPVGRQSQVVIDPDFSFGAPTIRGIRTEALAELVEAGEPTQLVAEDYSLPLPELKAALAYEWQPAA